MMMETDENSNTGDCEATHLTYRVMMNVTDESNN